MLSLGNRAHRENTNLSEVAENSEKLGAVEKQDFFVQFVNPNANFLI